MAVLGEQTFYQYCKVLKLSGQTASDPDKRQIERAFRKCALKTHPDKGGNPREFRRINEAYNRLLAHAAALEAIDVEAEFSQVSVIIEVSKQSVPNWSDRLRMAYGRPRTSNIRNPIFEGPAMQFRGHGGHTGPITLVLYTDPEDGVPKIHCRCDNYMAWIQEQNLPLHLHVNKDKKIMFDQWRIMSMAEFAFCKVGRGQSARHDWKESNEESIRKRKEQEEKEEEEERRKKKEERDRREKKEREEREERERRKREEEEATKKRTREPDRPWWSRHIGGCRDFAMSETTPPPDDLFPKESV